MKKFINIKITAATLVAIAVGVLSANANAPANDNIANAIDLGSGATSHVIGSNADATKEAGEPNHGFNVGGKSVWYKWTAPTHRLTQVSLFRSDFNTLLAVYTGTSMENLQLVISNNDMASGNQRSAIRFNPVAGQTYYIAVDGAMASGPQPEAGTVRLDLIPSITRWSVDHDRDGRTDLGVYRPTDGTWYVRASADNAFMAYRWGLDGDFPVPGTFTQTVFYSEPAMFRPSTGTFYVLHTSLFNYPSRVFRFGQSADIPVNGNFLGSLGGDYGVFRPSTGTWYFHEVEDNETKQVNFGQAGDIPVPGDYTHDEMTDIAVYRPSTGYWYILPQNSGETFGNARVIAFGQPGDKPVPADYDGDGLVDPAIYRPSTGQWWVLQSTDGQQRATQWGLSTDVPAVGEFDGDGRADHAVFRPSNGTWYIYQSSNQQARIEQWGLNGDMPVTSLIR